MTQAFTNIKNITKSSITGQEKMEHGYTRMEITYPASGRVEKTRVTKVTFLINDYAYLVAKLT